MAYLNHHIMLVIFLMGLMAWLNRLGGFWLAGRLKLSPPVKAWLECLPGCILMAIVAPLMLKADWIEWIAAVGVVLVMITTDKILYAMVIGIVLAALGHAYL